MKRRAIVISDVDFFGRHKSRPAEIDGSILILDGWIQNKHSRKEPLISMIRGTPFHKSERMEFIGAISFPERQKVEVDGLPSSNLSFGDCSDFDEKGTVQEKSSFQFQILYDQMQGNLLDTIKQYIESFDENVIFVEDEPSYRFLLTGPTGCGKSHMVKAIAAQLHLPLIEMDSHMTANDRPFEQLLSGSYEERQAMRCFSKRKHSKIKAVERIVLVEHVDLAWPDDRFYGPLKMFLDACSPSTIVIMTSNLDSRALKKLIALPEEIYCIDSVSVNPEAFNGEEGDRPLICKVPDIGAVPNRCSLFRAMKSEFGQIPELDWLLDIKPYWRKMEQLFRENLRNGSVRYSRGRRLCAYLSGCPIDLVDKVL